MTAFNHPGQTNEAYDRIIRRVEKWLVEKSPGLWKFEKVDVRERLAQVILSTSFDPYIALCARRFDEGRDVIPPDDQILKIGGLVIDPASGSVRITLRLLLRSFAIFIYFWLTFLRDILSGIVPLGKSEDRPATLLLGVNEKPFLYQGSDARFVEFCRQGPIKPLVKATRLLVQATKKIGNISYPDFVYTSNPISYLVSKSRLGAGGRFRLLLVHLFTPLKFIASFMLFPGMSLLGRDVAYAPIIRALDRRNLLEAVLITSSSALAQPLWMRGAANRNFLVHEIHYSQNTIVFQYVHGPQIAELPVFRHVRVDEHWVWTEGYKKHLEKSGQHGPYHVIGPIMWYLPVLSLPHAGDEFQIAVFDITPVYSEVAAKIGIINNYYTTENMLKFIDEIVTVCDELGNKFGKSIRILLKHKREFKNGSHDLRYIYRIKDLMASYMQFDLIDYDTNLFSILSSCNLSISVPFTSTAYISSHLEKPAIYFDPTSTLLPNQESSPFIQFVSCKEELTLAIEQCLSGINLKVR